MKQNLYNYVGESTSTFASEKGPPLADVERLKGNMRRELRNEKYPFNCTDFASPNLRIYTLTQGQIVDFLEFTWHPMGEANGPVAIHHPDLTSEHIHRRVMGISAPHTLSCKEARP